MLSGGADRSDWVRNLQANPTVTIRIGEERRAAVARVVTEMNEDALARRWLVESTVRATRASWTSGASRRCRSPSDGPTAK
jgi:hypothetical protein